MTGRKTVYMMMMLAAVQVGCAKSDDSEQKAHHALGASHLMPGGMPQAESAYVMDQASVKSLPAREVKYEALETFRIANAERGAKGEESNVDAESADAAADDQAPTKAKSKDGKKSESKGGLLKALGDKLKSATKPGAKATKPAEKAKTDKPVEKKSADKPPTEKKAEPAKKPAAAEDKKEAKKAEEKEEPTEGDKDAETAKEEGGEGEPAEGQQEGDEATQSEEREGGTEAEGQEGGESEEKTEEGAKPDEGGG